MHELISLSLLFCAWKALLLLVVSLGPGPGYDTSTALLSSNSNLVRWDAVYYVHKARHGDIFEQEWAFGKGISTLLAWTSSYDISATVAAGVGLAHASHLVSVFLLWDMTRLLCNTKAQASGYTQTLGFIAACLHIISPAGVFLSAPYSESTFSCLNMLGYWLYLQAQRSTRLGVKSGTLISSGLAFGLATVVRSNGILSGLPILFDAMALVLGLIVKTDPKLSRRRVSFELCTAILAGLFVAAGFALPQYLAYREYCFDQWSARPWCQFRMPLIYSFVQSHYWGVGFLRYWTFSNLPLFLLALPMLMLLLISGLDTLSEIGSKYGRTGMSLSLIQRLATPQIVLALLSITNYHVQIITRLSSGYPWHYIWLAESLCQRAKYTQMTVALFVMYGLIQGGLYASFLPPA